MCKTMKIIFSKYLFLALLFAVKPGHAETIIIVNGDNNIELDRDTVALIYLGKAVITEEGSRIVPLNQPENSPAYVSFSKDILRKSPKQLKAYWAKRIFTGKGRPPKTIDSEDEIITEVAKGDTNYIAYVNKIDSNNDLRIIILR